MSWLAQLGVFDFAGGIVIHTSAGMSSLAAVLVLKRRKNFGSALLLPHSIPLAVIGGSLLWLGWFGFNAGSDFITGALASNILIVTHIGSAMGAIVWVLFMETVWQSVANCCSQWNVSRSRSRNPVGRLHHSSERIHFGHNSRDYFLFCKSLVD